MVKRGWTDVRRRTYERRQRRSEGGRAGVGREGKGNVDRGRSLASRQSLGCLMGWPGREQSLFVQILVLTPCAEKRDTSRMRYIASNCCVSFCLLPLYTSRQEVPDRAIMDLKLVNDKAVPIPFGER
ncbi:hypothetical protein BDN70DRAFT_888634 [Pholiota conissans]|uniref:Uncharacterized protein n=1 Tax=Pholiota conissans TaxID=109636 RepID=A0A9P6CR85_9AGAR|nr:hypothetical protein BDN70DRAFT_888634 [Pholiota conissans]